MVAASDFFMFNVGRREEFDDIDRFKGDRTSIFEGPCVAPMLEDVGDARRRINGGGANAGQGPLQMPTGLPPFRSQPE